MEAQTCKHKLKCLYCHKEYTPTRTDRKFCTNSCKARNWEAKNIRKPLVVVYYTRESQKKGFLRKLWSWIW